MVSEKFAKAETSVWKNVVVAYSKCNAHEMPWSRVASKKANAGEPQLWHHKTAPQFHAPLP